MPTGPVPGLVYASAGRRLGAYILDSIILGVGSSVLTWPLLLPRYEQMSDPNWIYEVANSPEAWMFWPFDEPIFLAIGVLGVAISAAYFILSWRLMRGSPGQRVLGVYMGNAEDGRPLSWGRAAIRWLGLTLGPLPILGYLLPAPWNLAAVSLLGIVGFAWSIALLVTVAVNPRRQGLHDRWAGSLLVRRP